MTMNVGESKVSTCKPISQLFMVKSKQMHNRSVQVVDVDSILNRVPSKLIGGSVNVTTSNTTPGHPH